MNALILTLCLTTLGQRPSQAIEPEHAANPVYEAVRGEGLELYGKRVALPDPILRDGQSAEEQRAALRKVAGGDRAVDDLLRDSITAPIKMKVGKVEATGAALAVVDLWFSVRGDLDQIDPGRASAEASTSKPISVGNMTFESRVVGKDALDARQIPVVDEEDGASDLYVHSTSRLLDKVFLESTARISTSMSADSLVVASRTSTKFDDDAEFPNRWQPIGRRAGTEERGPFRAYPGGFSYMKVSRLEGHPGMLLVEGHLAFAEPDAWFQGAPILRSKISLVAQDRIRDLRRELAREHPDGP